MKKSDMDKLVTLVSKSNKAIMDLLVHLVTEINELQDRVKVLEATNLSDDNEALVECLCEDCDYEECLCSECYNKKCKDKRKCGMLKKVEE